MFASGYANVMATIAVFLALGGGAYAALELPRNSVGRNQIKANAVNSAKVAPDTLTGADIDESSLGAVPTSWGRTFDSVGYRPLGGLHFWERRRTPFNPA
jgi:hypothetical protein